MGANALFIAFKESDVQTPPVHDIQHTSVCVFLTCFCVSPRCYRMAEAQTRTARQVTVTVNEFLG